MLAKDSNLALAMAAVVGIRPPLGTQAAAQFQAALAAGFAGEDDARLLSLLQQQFAAASDPSDLTLQPTALAKPRDTPG